MFHVQHRIGSFKYFLVAVECVVHSTKRSLINELGAPDHNSTKRTSSPFLRRRNVRNSKDILR